MSVQDHVNELFILSSKHWICDNNFCHICFKQDNSRYISIEFTENFLGSSVEIKHTIKHAMKAQLKTWCWDAINDAIKDMIKDAVKDVIKDAVEDATNSSFTLKIFKALQDSHSPMPIQASFYTHISKWFEKFVLLHT